MIVLASEISPPVIMARTSRSGTRCSSRYSSSTPSAAVATSVSSAAR
jgi:hypothetical protein